MDYWMRDGNFKSIHRKKKGYLTVVVLYLFFAVTSRFRCSSAKSSVFLSQLREQILGILIDTINEVPASTPTETEVVARGLSSLIMQGDELSLEAQVQ